MHLCSAPGLLVGEVASESEEVEKAALAAEVQEAVTVMEATPLARTQTAKNDANGHQRHCIE